MRYLTIAAVCMFVAGCASSPPAAVTPMRTPPPPAAPSPAATTADFVPQDLGKRPDVLGVRLGMPVSEALDIIKTRFPGIIVTPMKTTADDGTPGEFRPVTVGYIAKLDADSKQNRYESFSIELHTLHEDGRIWAINRLSRYWGSKRPLSTTVAASLLEKYGSPSRKPTDKIFHWWFDPSGTQIGQTTAGGDPCFDAYKYYYGDADLPITFRKNCGYAIYAEYDTPRGKGQEALLTTNIGITLIDSYGHYQRLIERKNAGMKRIQELNTKVKPML